MRDSMVPSARYGKTGLRTTFAIMALSLSLSTAMAQSAFVAPDKTFSGRISAAAAERSQAIVPGSEIILSGSNFKPGQEVTLSRGDTVLNADGPYVADAEGNFKAELALPADAVPGQHPILVNVANPSGGDVFKLKISPDVPLSGEDKFTLTSEKLVPGLYQVAYSDASNALFVTSAVGRPPVKESQLLKLDADSLAILAQVTPGAVPARPDGSEAGVFAVYGVEVDDANGNVWVTNTRQNTVAVYKQDDLSLVKQFDVGAVNHARDVVVDTKGGKAYASATQTGDIVVFDTKTLEIVDTITLTSSKRGGEFSVGSLQLDPTTGEIYTVSLSTGEAAVIDLASGKVDKVFPLENADGAIGVGYDAETDRLFVASQGSDNLLIVDTKSGEVLHDVAVGSGPLNVEFDPVNKLAYVSVRGSGTVTVVDGEGQIVANLDNGSSPNYVVADGKGNIYAINKSNGADDPVGDRVTKITPAS